MTDLGTVGGRESWAESINDAGQVVGWSDTKSGADHAFITGPNGVGMTDLGTLGGEYSVASGINDAGQAVGGSGTAAGNYHAFITGPDGVGMTDLNSLVDLPAGVVLEQAIAINNMGQVIVITGMPEPESYALMLAGLILLGFVARRKSLPA
jgi:probable HAF family extracellular repeat protein